jgi:hypothetical protein
MVCSHSVYTTDTVIYLRLKVHIEKFPNRLGAVQESNVKRDKVSRLWIIFGAMSILAPMGTMAADPAQLSCQCVAGGPEACVLKIWDAASGSQRMDWTQSIYLKGDETSLDLTMACYRKRNVIDGGNGLCCEANGDAEIQRLFKGILRQDIP